MQTHNFTKCYVLRSYLLPLPYYPLSHREVETEFVPKIPRVLFPRIKHAEFK